LFRYDRSRKQLWLFGFRVHHGLVGSLLAVVGAVLAWHDRLDFRSWLDWHRQR